MHTSDTYTIGISLGTQVIGIAILEGKALVYWQTKTVKGIWYEKKLQTCLNSIQSLLNKYEVSHCAIKTIHHSQISNGYTELLSSLETMCREKGIAIYNYRIEDLKCFCQNTSRGSKECMLTYIRKHYAEWNHKQYHKPYYLKVQEAIITALLSQNEQ